MALDDLAGDGAAGPQAVAHQALIGLDGHHDRAGELGIRSAVAPAARIVGPLEFRQPPLAGARPKLHGHRFHRGDPQWTLGLRNHRPGGQRGAAEGGQEGPAGWHGGQQSSIPTAPSTRRCPGRPGRHKSASCRRNSLAQAAGRLPGGVHYFRWWVGVSRLQRCRSVAVRTGGARAGQLGEPLGRSRGREERRVLARGGQL